MGPQCASGPVPAQAERVAFGCCSNAPGFFLASLFNIKVLYNSLVMLVEGAGFCGQVQIVQFRQGLASMKTLCAEGL
jgi:hypothetical protein